MDHLTQPREERQTASIQGSKGYAERGCTYTGSYTADLRETIAGDLMLRPNAQDQPPDKPKAWPVGWSE